MLEQLRKEVKLEASLLIRKYTTLGGALYIANCVILPRILYSLKFTPASCEEIDSLHRHVLGILLSKCGLKGRKLMLSSLAAMQAWHGCGGAIKSTANGSKS
jgi:hypothetical protein